MAGGFQQLINKMRDTEGSRETANVLRSLERKLDDDSFDQTKALHDVERRVNNRMADVAAEQEAKYIRGEVGSKVADNPLESNEVTRLYVESLKDIVGEMHHMSRQELKSNQVRMQALMTSIKDASDDELPERQFLIEQYKQSADFMTKEYERRSGIASVAFNKIGELGEQYFDLQSIYAGLVDHNPVMMALFKITGDVIGSWRKKKKAQKEMVMEDQRRQSFAKKVEEDKEDDIRLEAERQEKIDEAQQEAIAAGAIGPDEDELQVTNENEFAFPEDEYSGTGDAAMDVSGFFGGDSFTRDHDAEAEAERQEAMAFMRKRKGLDTEEPLEPDNAPIAQAIEDGVKDITAQQKTQHAKEQAFTREDERERDEWESENTMWNEQVLTKLDTIANKLDDNKEAFSKVAGAAGGAGGAGGDGGMMDTLVSGGAAALFTKYGGKLLKPFSAVMKLAAPVVAGSAALLGKVGLGKAGGALMGKFTGAGSKVVGKEAAEAISKQAVEKGAAKSAAKAAAGGGMFTKAAGAVKGKATDAIGTARKAVLEGGEKYSALAGAKMAGAPGTKVAGKAAEAAGKGVGKSLIKKIPLVGLLAGVGFGISRLLDGDFTGAGLEVLSGAASIVPGVGTAASVGIDAGLIARDMGAFDRNSEESLGLEKGAKEGESKVEEAVKRAQRDKDIQAAVDSMPPYNFDSKKQTFSKASEQTGKARPRVDWSQYANTGAGQAGRKGPTREEILSGNYGQGAGISAGTAYKGYDAPTRATRPVAPDYTGNTPTQPVSAMNLTGTGKEKGVGIAQKLMDDGYSAATASGMVGNMMVETGQFKHHQELNPRGGRGGAGWLQWTGKRRRNFEAYAESQGLDPKSDEANYGFLKHEMEGNTGDHWTKKGMKIGGRSATKDYSLEEYKSIEDPQEAAKYFMEGYERPGVLHQEKRQGYGQAIADQLDSGPKPAAQQKGMVASTANLKQLEAVPSRAAVNANTLEQTVTEKNIATDQKQQRNLAAAMPPPLGPPSQNAVSKQTGSDGGRASAPPGAATARNNDSTVSRLTDRWISHSFV